MLHNTFSNHVTLSATDNKCSFDYYLVNYADNTYTTSPTICSDEFREFPEVVASACGILCPPQTIIDAMELLIVLREMCEYNMI